MTNPRIERVKAAIAKTKTTIAEYQNKLRELERQKVQYENEEIVALFRRERLNEDEFSALLRSQKKDNPADNPLDDAGKEADILENSTRNGADSPVEANSPLETAGSALQ